MSFSLHRAFYCCVWEEYVDFSDRTSPKNFGIDFVGLTTWIGI